MTIGKPTEMNDLDDVQQDVDLQAERELTDQLIAQLLDRVHPVVAQGILAAAVPQRYNLALLTVLRRRDDDKDEKMLNRLAGYPFIAPAGIPNWYAVTDLHRQLLQARFVQEHPAEYVAAHGRARQFWQESAEHEDDRIRVQNIIYHGLVADANVTDVTAVPSLNLLVETFRTYVNDRQLVAIERLLHAVNEAHTLTAPLQPAWRSRLTDLLPYLQARLSQLKGNWSASEGPLADLWARTAEMAPQLRPYVTRAYGQARLHAGDYTAGMAAFKKALHMFTALTKEADDDHLRRTLEGERGATMLALGDAYRELAIAARGEKELVRDTGAWPMFEAWLATFLSLPMVLYLTVFFGLRAWTPRFWVALCGEDWIIARLYAYSYRWYQRAYAHLEQHATAGEVVTAEERLAYLSLEIGDVWQAADQFERLLNTEEEILSRYRQASARTGLAEALLRRRRFGRAHTLLRQSIPVLADYKDYKLEARARALHAEGLYQMQDYDPAGRAFRAASVLYQSQEDWVRATQVADRLEEILSADDIPAGFKRLVRPAVEGLDKRQYPIRFSHILLQLFRLAMLGVLGVALFAVPSYVLEYQTSPRLSPAISFRPRPLLDIDNTFVANIGRGLQETAAAQAELGLDSVSLIGVAVLVTVVGIILSLTAGLLLIQFTPTRTVQAHGDAGLVTITAEGITIGRGEQARSLQWSQVTRFLKTDVGFLSDRPFEWSTFALAGDGKRLTIAGQTRRYLQAQAVVRRHLPQSVDTVALNHTAVRSGWFFMYVCGVLLIWGLIPLTYLNPGLVWQPLPLTNYRLGDLYPYLYVFMFTPPIFWGGYLPLRHRAVVEPRSVWVFGLLGVALGLVALQVATRFHVLILQPDIYIPLLTIILLGMVSGYLWLTNAYGRSTSIAMTVLAAVLIGLMGTRLVRDVSAYHYLVQAGTYQQAGQTLRTNGEPAEQAYQQALYNAIAAAQVAARPVWGIGGRPLPQATWDWPRTHRQTWIQATRMVGTLHAELGQYERAIAEYEMLLPYYDYQAEERARLLGWIGIAQQSAGTGAALLGTADDESALETYTEAINSHPLRAELYLWRAVTYHSLGRADEARDDYLRALEAPHDTQRYGIDTPTYEPLTERQRAQALNGLGWVSFAEDNSSQALTYFQQADEIASAEDTLLGLGYTYYNLTLYSLAADKLQTAVAQDPSDPLPVIALGTVRWRQATRLEGLDRGAACDDEDGDPALIAEAADLFAQSETLFVTSTAMGGQTPVDVAYTWRTIGQIRYLQRNCPDHDYVERMETAIDAYSEAIDLDTGRSLYWEMRGRLRYALWARNSDNDLLLAAYADLRMAEVLDEDGRLSADLAKFLEFSVGSLINEFGQDEFMTVARTVEADLPPYQTAIDTAVGESCQYNMRFVDDITIPDDTVMMPGEPFTKVWRIRNSGNCPWTADTRWVFVDGAQMGAPSPAGLDEARPAEMVDVVIPFVAPQEPGTYRSDWTLQAPDGERLGKTYYVQIVVPAPTPTSTPPYAPSPTATITPDPSATPTLTPPAPPPPPLSSPSGGGEDGDGDGDR